MQVVSKFRTGFFIRAFIMYSFALAFKIGILFLTYDNSKFDYESFVFWGAIVLILIFLFVVLSFLLTEIKQLTITEKGIEIKYSLSKEVNFVPFNQILKISTRHIRGKQGAGLTAGYQEMEVFLANNDSIK